MKYVRQQRLWTFAASVLPLAVVLAAFWSGLFSTGSVQHYRRVDAVIFLFAVALMIVSAWGFTRWRARSFRGVDWRRCERCGEVFTGDAETQCGGCGERFVGLAVRQRWRERYLLGFVKGSSGSLVLVVPIVLFGAAHLVGIAFSGEIDRAMSALLRDVFVYVIPACVVLEAVWAAVVVRKRNRCVREAKWRVCECCGYPYEGDGEVTCAECGDRFNGGEVYARWRKRVSG